MSSSNYPTNSSFIDMRSRIRTPVLKTRLILNELEKTIRSPSAASNASQSRPASALSNASRASTPTTLQQQSHRFTPLQRSFTANANAASTTQKHHTPILKSVNRRKPESDVRPNVFTIDDDDEEDGDKKKTSVEELEKIQSLLGKDMIKSFLSMENADEPPEFTFDAPKVRGPRKRKASPPPPVTKEAASSALVEKSSLPPPAKKSSLDSGPTTNATFPSSLTNGNASLTLAPPAAAAPVKKWSCPECWIQNEPEKEKCPACETPKPKKWSCPTCWIQNEPDQEKCPACETPKPGSSGAAATESAPPKPAFKPQTFQAPSTAAPLQFAFGVPTGNQASFSFGSTPATNNNATGGATSGDSSAPFVFGSSAATSSTSLPTFSSVPPSAAALVKKWSCPKCCIQNEPEKEKCPACDTPKPEKWSCPTCWVQNEPDKEKCPACETPKPGSSGATATESAPPKPAFKPQTFQAPSAAATESAPPKPAFKPQTFQAPSAAATESDPSKPAFKPQAFQAPSAAATESDPLKPTFKPQAFQAPPAAVPFQFAFGAPTVNQASFSFGSTPATNNNATGGATSGGSSAPFVFGGGGGTTTGSTSLPTFSSVPAAPTINPLAPTLPGSLDTPNPFSASPSASTLARRKLAAKRRKF